MKIKTILLALLIATVFCGNQALFASAPRLGSAGAVELTIPMGARNVGLAGSNIANVQGVESIYWNPAGLSRINDTEVGFTYLNYFADMNISYLALGKNVGSLGVLGFSFQAFDIGEIPVTTIEVPEGTGEIIKPMYMTLDATYSKKFTDRIHFGVNAKYVMEKIGDMSANAVGFDFGLQYTSPMGVDFGVILKNIGTEIQFSGTGIEFDSDVQWANPNATTRKTVLDMASNELPTSMALGLAYTYDIDEVNAVNLCGLYENNAFNFEQIAVGAEYGFHKMFYGRVGYSIPLYPEDYPEDVKEYQYGLTLGFGAHMLFNGRTIMFDYAYRDMDIFDAQQYIGLTISM